MLSFFAIYTAKVTKQTLPFREKCLVSVLPGWLSAEISDTTVSFFRSLIRKRDSFQRHFQFQKVPLPS